MRTKFALSVLAGLFLIAGVASAQTVAYEQTNLSSDLATTEPTNPLDLSLRDPWGIAAPTGFPFFVANTNSSRVRPLDAAGSATGPAGFAVPNATNNGAGAPIGMIADIGSLFTGGEPGQQFRISIISATEDGGLFFWGVDQEGNFPTHAHVVVDNSPSAAVYTSLAILKPDCCAPFLAVSNFRSGKVEMFNTDFSPIGSFFDSTLPAGFAPYGMQVIDDQLFVASAMQDASQRKPLFAAGNGIVSVFDLQGHFLRQFAAGGSLNAPWGIAKASANFGPFSNDILIGNSGDGTISAFDPASGNFVGQVKDGDGNVIVNSGLHALVFRADGFADANTLYFTAGINNEEDGLFGTIKTGLVSTTTVTAPAATVDGAATIAVTVSAADGNTGPPTGQVTIRVDGVALATSTLVAGAATFNTTFSKAGMHGLEAQYSGDANFLPSIFRTQVEVTALATNVTLTAPAEAAPGATVTLSATVSSPGGIPTGQIEFRDGRTTLGSVAVDDSGAAVLRTNTLALGSHSLTAFYDGDGKFSAAASTAQTISIANADFSIAAAPPSATVALGQSTDFALTVTPAGGFANNVTFSCAPVAGIACNFNPATVSPANGAARTTLSVTASSKLAGSATLLLIVMGSTCLFASLVVFAFAMRGAEKSWFPQRYLVTCGTALSMAGLLFCLAGCGGGAGVAQPNGTTVSVNVTAQSGAISHNTVVTVTVQ